MESSLELQPLIETLNNAQIPIKSRSHFSPVLQTTSRALLRLSQFLGRPFRLGVLGELNAGKTTITNLIAGGITLPVLPVANTRLPTLLRYAPVPRIEALCENGQKFTLTPDDKLVVPDILRLEVGLPSEHLRRVELLDFPGSANPLFHADVALIPRHGVDAVIWATVATQAWRETERRAWSKLPQRLRRRGILAVTQCDLIRDEADFSKLKARLQRVQEEHFTSLCFVAAERKHEMAEAGSKKHAPATLRYEVERLRQGFNAERGRKAVLITRRIASRALARMEPIVTAKLPVEKRHNVWSVANSLLPGLLLTAALTDAAYALRLLSGVTALSPLFIAILLGILYHNAVGTPSPAKAGVVFALRRLLRVAIILLGLQITAQQVGQVGGGGIAIILATVATAFLLTKLMGRVLGVEAKLAELIAAGTSICGASAVIATNTATNGSDEDVAYAIACVTVFGSIAMFTYPFIGAALRLDAHAYGLWTGASIHEIAQVMAAAFHEGPQSGEFGTIAKLSRVILLAPLVLWLGFLKRVSGADQGAAPIPWFVLGFLALIGLNSLGIVPQAVKAVAIPLTALLLTLSLAAMGLETDIRKLKAKGMRPLLLGALSTILISALSLSLIGLSK